MYKTIQLNIRGQRPRMFRIMSLGGFVRTCRRMLGRSYRVNYYEFTTRLESHYTRVGILDQNGPVRHIVSVDLETGEVGSRPAERGWLEGSR